MSQAVSDQLQILLLSVKVVKKLSQMSIFQIHAQTDVWIQIAFFSVMRLHLVVLMRHTPGTE